MKANAVIKSTRIHHVGYFELSIYNGKFDKTSWSDHSVCLPNIFIDVYQISL